MRRRRSSRQGAKLQDNRMMRIRYIALLGAANQNNAVVASEKGEAIYSLFDVLQGVTLSNEPILKRLPWM